MGVFDIKIQHVDEISLTHEGEIFMVVSCDMAYRHMVDIMCQIREVRGDDEFLKMIKETE